MTWRHVPGTRSRNGLSLKRFPSLSLSFSLAHTHTPYLFEIKKNVYFCRFLKNASLLITVSENNDSKPGTISHHSGNSGNFTLCGESFFWKNNSLYSCSAKDYFTVTCVIHPLPALTIHPTRKFLVLLCMHIIHEESQLLEILTYPCGTINFGVQQMIGATLVGSSLLQTDNFLSFHGKLQSKNFHFVYWFGKCRDLLVLLMEFVVLEISAWIKEIGRPSLNFRLVCVHLHKHLWEKHESIFLSSV